MVLVLLLLTVSAAAQELTWETFDSWREYLAPSEGEECWREIAWRESLREAVTDAHRERKPILLWAMNGHPLGCV